MLGVQLLVYSDDTSVLDKALKSWLKLYPTQAEELERQQKAAADMSKQLDVSCELVPGNVADAAQASSIRSGAAPAISPSGPNASTRAAAAFGVAGGSLSHRSPTVDAAACKLTDLEQKVSLSSPAHANTLQDSSMEGPAGTSAVTAVSLGGPERNPGHKASVAVPRQAEVSELKHNLTALQVRLQETSDLMCHNKCLLHPATASCSQRKLT